MHGRARIPLSKGAPLDEAELQRQAAAAKKALLFSRLLSEVLSNHKEQRYEGDALEKSARLLEINPEIYTAWNYRKLAVQHQMRKAGDDESSKKSITETELRLVERALQKNYKAYGAWHHRKWVVELGFSPIDRELKLIEKFLNADDRNFHGWDYRRFLVKQKATASPESELKYTTEKIDQNFSSYSAWHYRSYLLPQIYKGGSDEISSKQWKRWLDEEFELIRQGFFTEPEDQSVWMYHSWLVGQTVPAAEPHLISVWPPPDARLMGVVLNEVPLSSPRQLADKLSGMHCGEEEEVFARPLDDRVHSNSQGSKDVVAAVWVPLVLAFDVPVTDLDKRVEIKICGGDEDGGMRADCFWEGVSSQNGRWSSSLCSSLASPSSSVSKIWRTRVMLREPWAAGKEAEELRGAGCMAPVLGKDASELWRIEVAVNIGRDTVVTHDGAPFDGSIVRYSFCIDRRSAVGGEVIADNNRSPWPEVVQLDRQSSKGEPSPFCDIMEEGVHGSADGLSGRAKGNATANGESIGYRRPKIDEDSVGGSWWRETLANEIEVCRGLLELEDNSKWTMLTLARLLRAQGDERDTEEVLQLYERLIEVDPYHKGYYQDLHSQLALQQRAKCLVQCIADDGYVRLSGHSLYRLGFNKQLLWVRKLDLSHNCLRSTTGLEALQLLTSLDLSYNLITHTSSLLPLHSLPLLCYLNLAHNKIGTQEVDTQFYYASSLAPNLPPLPAAPPPPTPPPTPSPSITCLSEFEHFGEPVCEELVEKSTAQEVGSLERDGDAADVLEEKVCRIFDREEKGGRDEGESRGEWKEVMSLLFGLWGLRVSSLGMVGNQVTNKRVCREALRTLLPCLSLLDNSPI